METNARTQSTSPSPCCRSGKCQICLENMRWDRLFDQKFADPYYYIRRQVLWPITPLAQSLSRTDWAANRKAMNQGGAVAGAVHMKPASARQRPA